MQQMFTQLLTDYYVGAAVCSALHFLMDSKRSEVFFCPLQQISHVGNQSSLLVLSN